LEQCLIESENTDSYGKTLIKTIVIGLVIALMGVALLSSFGEAVTYVRPMAIATKGETGQNDSWTISANLTAGDNVMFEYRDGWNWTQGFFDTPDDGSETPTLWVFVSFGPVDPPGNATGFAVETRLTTTSAGEGVSGSRLTIFNISVPQEGSIDTSVIGRDPKGRLHEVGGRIPWDGTYEAVVRAYPSRTAAPSFLGLYHNITVTSYPNSSLLPVGGTVIVIGGTLLAYGVRGTINHTGNRRRKIEKKMAQFYCRQPSDT
jgi:hypothetical protein